MALPVWDIDLAIAEMHRCAAMGHKGIVLSSQLEVWGQPHITQAHWDPMWSEAQDMGLSINFHIGSGDTASMFGTMTQLPEAGTHANFASLGLPSFLGNARAIANIICGGVCHRFPRLNFVSVESGVGWLPFALACLDWQWKNSGVPLEHPEYDLLPSEYFQRQIYGCFWFEHETVKATIDLIGADHLMYETDFPHSTSMSPGPASVALPPNEFIEQSIGELSDDVARKLLHDNAARLYHLD
jgi:predicted TIM-barrel fold metal-dependent hydrolase